MMACFCFVLHGLLWCVEQDCLGLSWPFLCVLAWLLRYCGKEGTFLVGQIGAICVGHDAVVVIWVLLSFWWKKWLMLGVVSVQRCHFGGISY